MSADAEPTRRGRRRRADRAKDRDRVSEQPPFKQPRMRYEPTRAVSDDELEAIHQASLNVLANTGIEFLHPEARSLLHKAGADVNEETFRVRFDPEMIAEYVSKAPSEFTVHGLSPERNVQVGGDWRNWETWEEAGSPRADERANTMARELIASHESPPMNDDMKTELREFVDRRISEGGIETDF